MPKRREQIYEVGRPYHVVGNAVEKRGIFESSQDCSRFIFQMYAANAGSPGANLHRVNMEHIAKALLGESSGQGATPEKFVKLLHPPLVEFFSFSLVRDHYHFGLVPTVKKGISQYMQKLNLGFAKYFNLKYHRRGPLFETRFRAAPIKNAKQAEAIVQHINIKSILDIYKPNWQKKGFEQEQLAIDFLSEYPYSSFPDLFKSRTSALISMGSRNELKKILKENFLKHKESYLEVFNAYMKGESEGFEHILLE